MHFFFYFFLFEKNLERVLWCVRAQVWPFNLIHTGKKSMVQDLILQLIVTFESIVPKKRLLNCLTILLEGLKLMEHFCHALLKFSRFLTNPVFFSH